MSHIKRKGNQEMMILGALASHGADWDMGYHEHESAEISVVLEGSGAVYWNGQEEMLEAGHVVMIAPGLSHRFRAETPIRFGVLQFTLDAQEVQEQFQRVAAEEAMSLIRLSPMDLQAYGILYRSCLKFISQPLQQAQHCYRAWTEVLLLFLLQHMSSHGRAWSIRQAADFIRSHLQLELRISDLAQHSGLSESAFRGAFTAQFGMSPKQYQQQCRLAEAKWLLRSSDQPLTYIAESIGYASLHSFSRWFQEVEGNSPSAWRKLQQGGRS